MSSIYGKTSSRLPSAKKKTIQGQGSHTKTSHSGGETFHENRRAGSPPGPRHQRKKPYRGQGK